MRPSFDSMVGASTGMRGVFDAIERIAASDLSVLVLGETGTGKELVARSLHRRSPRSKGPFIALNCAALPAQLVESELFGYEKGAFTGAVMARPGHVELAHGGTLFLDEIAEMQLGAQAKLLRVVQEKRVQRLGATRDRAVDLRIIAATHQDLPARVEAATFRRDLYHRLDEVRVVLPALRDRDGNIELIAEAIVERLSSDLGRSLRLGTATRAALRDYDWPGNVRELENTLRRAATGASGDEILPGDLRLESASPPRTLSETLETATEAALRGSLRRHAGDAERAAAELAIPLDELRRLVARFHIPLRRESIR